MLSFSPSGEQRIDAIISAPVKASADIRRIDFIDSMRGLAALGVIAAHVVGFNPNASRALIVAGSTGGGRGVQLFFLLSALTLFYSVQNRRSVEKHPTTNFILRRFFRIAPLFWTAAIFYLLRDGLGPRPWVGAGAPHLTTFGIAITFAMAHGLSPYWINCIVPGGWSVGDEMLFYCFVPILFRWIPTIKAAIIGLILSLVAVKIYIAIGIRILPIPSQDIWSSFVFFAVPMQLPAFFSGIFVFHLIFHLRFQMRVQGRPFSKLLGTTLAVGALVMAFGTEAVIHRQIALHYYTAFFTILVIGLAVHPTALLVNPFFKFLGTVSFSLYLVQFATIPLVDSVVSKISFNSANVRLLVEMFAAVALTVAISCVTYSIVEKPGQRVGKRIIKAIDYA